MNKQQQDTWKIGAITYVLGAFPFLLGDIESVYCVAMDDWDLTFRDDDGFQLPARMWRKWSRDNSAMLLASSFQGDQKTNVFVNICDVIQKYGSI